MFSGDAGEVLGPLLLLIYSAACAELKDRKLLEAAEDFSVWEFPCAVSCCLHHLSSFWCLPGDPKASEKLVQTVISWKNSWTGLCWEKDWCGRKAAENFQEPEKSQVNKERLWTWKALNSCQSTRVFMCLSQRIWAQEGAQYMKCLEDISTGSYLGIPQLKIAVGRDVSKGGGVQGR